MIKSNLNFFFMNAGKLIRILLLLLLSCKYQRNIYVVNGPVAKNKITDHGH